MDIASVKTVIDACKNYYDIMEERYAKDDEISKEILTHYKYVIEHTSLNGDDLNRTILFDECVWAYFDDMKFHDDILSKIKYFDKQISLVDFMISSYTNYKNDPTNNVVATKWI